MTSNLTRQEFLIASAGALGGVSLFGLGGFGGGVWEADAATANPSIVRAGWPRAFFFRQPEREAASGEFAYAEWEKRNLPLGGIMGKVLNEELDYSEKYNLSYFLRYKARNPSKMVILHYNGTGRRATDGTNTAFFAGHWLYYKGTRLTRPVGASLSETVLRVADTSVFRMKRYKRSLSDDIAIAPPDRDGKPDWSRAEQVRLKTIKNESKAIIVDRGAYGTAPRSFPEGSYLAAHVTTGPYTYPGGPPGAGDPLWGYNFSTAGPRDSRGRNGADALADYLVGKFRPGGALAAFDGISLDVFSCIVRFAHPADDVDVDTDGRADGGLVNGTNTVVSGSVRFTRALRERLPGKIILADGQFIEDSQRSFGHLNGMESEGYPDTSDDELDGLSKGENLFNFWKQNSASPLLNYVNFKYLDRNPVRPRNEFVEPSLSEDRSYKKLRLALASALFTDTVFTSIGDCGEDGVWAPPETPWRQGGVAVRVFDELWRGVDQRPNWLGLPLGRAVHLAGRTPDLLNGRGVSWPADYIDRMRGSRISFSRTNKPRPSMVVRKISPDSDVPVLQRRIEFALPRLNVPRQDLFVSLRLRAATLEGYSALIARRVYVKISSESGQTLESFTWANERAFTANFYARKAGPGPVDLTFSVEGDEPVYLERLTAHSAADAVYREYRNGAVFANLSDGPYTFDLQRLLPGDSFRRISGSDNQDPDINNGRDLGATLTLGPRDALLVVRNGG